METRKIQQVSNGTFTVSLPREWADGEGITAGTVVNLHTHLDGMLVIQAPECEDDASNRVTVEVGHDDPAETSSGASGLRCRGRVRRSELPDGYSDAQHRAIDASPATSSA